MSQTTKTGKIRVQFDFTESQVKELDALVESANASTRAEIVRAAVRVYGILLEAQSKGAAIILDYGEKRAELLLPHELDLTRPIGSIGETNAAPCETGKGESNTGS